MSEGGKEAVRADHEVVAKTDVAVLQKQIREPQRVKLAIVARGRYTVRRVALFLGVSLSQVSQRLKDPGQVALELAQARGR